MTLKVKYLECNAKDAASRGGETFRPALPEDPRLGCSSFWQPGSPAEPTCALLVAMLVQDRGILLFKNYLPVGN